MSGTIRYVLLALACGVASTGGTVAAQEEQRTRWQKPHQPTKLDWLVLTLEATARVECSTPHQGCVTLRFTAVAPKTVRIDVLRVGPISEEDVRTLVELSRGSIIMAAHRILQEEPVTIEVRDVRLEDHLKDLEPRREK